MKKEVTIIDKLGFQHIVDLGTVPFILQEKGTTFRDVLDDLIKKGDLETAKKRIGQIIDLYISEYQKGLYDRDHGVMHNAGFVGERPIHLDVGKMSKDDRMKIMSEHQKDMDLVAAKIQDWLQKQHPKEYPELNGYMQEKLTKYFEKLQTNINQGSQVSPQP